MCLCLTLTPNPKPNRPINTFGISDLRNIEQLPSWLNDRTKWPRPNQLRWFSIRHTESIRSLPADLGLGSYIQEKSSHIRTYWWPPPAAEWRWTICLPGALHVGGQAPEQLNARPVDLPTISQHNISREVVRMNVCNQPGLRYKNRCFCTFSHCSQKEQMQHGKYFTESR